MEKEVRKSKLVVTGHIAGVKPSAQNPLGYKGAGSGTRIFTKDNNPQWSINERGDFDFSLFVSYCKRLSEASLQSMKAEYQRLHDVTPSQERIMKERIDAIDLELLSRAKQEQEVEL